MQPTNRGKSRPRVLYWFRTPPNIKVGRPPFDPEVQRALEAQNPDVSFDWQRIVNTPVPPPAEAERWRERRRVERAMRAEPEEEFATPTEDAMPSPPLAESGSTDAAETVEVDIAPAATEAAPASDMTTMSPAQVPPPAHVGGRHRRRRRRRGRRPPGGSTVESGTAQSSEAKPVQDSESSKKDFEP